MRQPTLWKTSFAALALLGAMACQDREAPLAPSAPGSGEPTRQDIQVTCVASVSQGSVACARPAGGGDQALIIGGQGRYVQLSSSNIVVNADTFSVDVTVQNLIRQPMGTLDGTTPHPDGVRVFFASGPTTTSGSGDVFVGNPDGLATFLAADQAYFQYPGILQHNQVTAPREWQFVFEPGVDAFAFTVYVSTEVPNTEEWIDFAETLPYLLVGSDTALNAVVRDRVGNEIDAEIEWSSSNPAVASVDSTGRVQGLTLGFATLTATSGGLTAEMTVGVCPVFFVGDDRSYDGAGASRFCLPGGDAGIEYVLVPVNTSTAAPVEVTTSASGIGPVLGGPNPALVPLTTALFSRSAAADVADLHDRGSVRRVGSRSLAPGGPSFAITPGVPTVGDLWTLNTVEGCSGGTVAAGGEVVVVGEHSIIVVDTTAPADPGLAFYQELADTIDNVVAPVVYTNFNGGTLAEPTDIDANDRVVYFFTPAVNQQLDPAVSDEYGYFAPRDLESTASCERSNEGEIIYLAVPDPAGTVGTPLTADSVTFYASRTIAHELQHLVNRSYRGNAGNPAEEAWLDESMSRVAEELVFFAGTGLAPEQNIGGAAFSGGNAWRALPFARLLRRNFLHMQWWLEAPDTTGAANPNVSLASGGAGWAFLRYYLDRALTPEAQAGSLTALVRSPQAGVANLTGSVGGEFATFLADWAAAMYVDDVVSGIDGEFNNRSWNFRVLFAGTTGYPVVTTALDDGVPLTRTYSEGGGAGYIRFSVPAGEFTTVTNEVAGGAPPSTVRMRVLRTQ